MAYEVSRRSFLKGAGVIGAAGLLSACGGSSSNNGTATSAASGTAAPNTTGEFPVVLLSIGMLIARAVIRLKQQLRLPKQALRVGLTGSMSSRTRNTMISSALKI